MSYIIYYLLYIIYYILYIIYYILHIIYYILYIIYYILYIIYYTRDEAWPSRCKHIAADRAMQAPSICQSLGLSLVATSSQPWRANLVDVSPGRSTQSCKASRAKASQGTENRPLGLSGAPKIDPKSRSGASRGTPKRTRSSQARSGASSMRPGSAPGAPGESQKVSL